MPETKYPRLMRGGKKRGDADMEERARYGSDQAPDSPTSFADFLHKGYCPGLDDELKAEIDSCIKAVQLTKRPATVTLKLKFKPEQGKYGLRVDIEPDVSTKLPKLGIEKGSAFVVKSGALSLHPENQLPLKMDVPPRAAAGG